jgi:hypothetical protein
MAIAMALIGASSHFPGMTVFQNIRGGELRVNMVLLLLMLASQVALAAMLFLYIREMRRAAFRYRGDDGGVDRIWSVVSDLSQLTLLSLVLYMGFVVAMFNGVLIVTAGALFEWGRIILLATFFAFFVLDGLLWVAGSRLAREAAKALGAASGSENAPLALAQRQAENDRDLAFMSLLLIDLPVLALALGALWLRWLMVHSGGYDVVFDHAFVSCGIEGAPNKDLADLFGNGVDAGVTIGLMVFSQLEFVVLKGRWALNRQ